MYLLHVITICIHSNIGGVTWLHESNSYIMDEFHLHGNTHVAMYGNASQIPVHFRAKTLVGDRSGVLHVGRYQSSSFDDVDVYYPINTLVYYQGSLQVPRRMSLR